MREQEEKQQLGFWMTTALVVGGMIGAGIFMLPVSLAPFGANAVIGWIVSGIGALALAYSMGRLARGGGQGIQAHIERAFGPDIAFLSTFAFWVSVWAANAAVAIAAAAATARIVPALGGDTATLLTAIGYMLFLTMTNALGSLATGRMAILTTLIKIMPLLAVLFVIGQVSSSGAELAQLAPRPISFDNIAAASALTLFALLGFETALAPVDKIRNPERNILLAMVGGTVFVAIIYLLSSTAILWLLPAETIASSKAPFADAIGRGWGEWGALFAAFGMAVSGFGYINGGIMVAGELGYSMAVRGELPQVMARTRHVNTPVYSQLIGSALAIFLIAANMSKGTAGLFTFAALLTTSATLWLYLASALASLKQKPGPLALVATIAGLAFIAFAFYGSGWEANLWSVALLITGFGIKRLTGSRPTPRQEAAPVAPQE
ncbi:MAG TPA: amino acid permease [Sphingomicrobium sp.]|nr:amino acid permease [Sphingomicrobium sp.]